jgi:tetratricopeptide (TPR) repeat protein
MASIFLSYSREDRKRAEQVAQGLGAAGHKVWWDRHIHAGSRFSKEIDAALRSADLVMVLWSKSSVDSAWVHDEAAAGRDSGRLVPVLIESVQPPLGFRQYQAVDLSGRRGKNDAAVGGLVAAVAERLGAAAPAPSLEKRRFGWLQSWRIRIAVITFLLLIVGGVWWLSSPRANPQSLVVAATDPASESIAKEIAANLASFKLGPLADLEVLAARGSRAQYKAEVALTRAGPQSELHLSFGPRTAPALWTAKLNGSTAQESDLRLHATQQLGSVVACAIDPKITSARLSDKLLRHYLNGCARMASFSDGLDPVAIENFRQITLELPKFAPAWGQLELAQYRALISAPGPLKRDFAFQARGAWEQAMALDPAMPQNFIVDAFVYREDSSYVARALGIIDKGLKLNPDNPLLLSARADMLTSVGRLKDASKSANEAMWGDPLSPYLLGNQVMLLVYTGQVRQAEQELISAERKWPGASAVQALRWGFELRYGDPTRALRLLRARKGVSLDLQSEASRWTLYLEARADPTPARMEAALNAYRAEFRKDPGNPIQFIQALATFGRNDEVFEVLSRPETIESMPGNSDLLFRPYFAGVRADPRFMDLTNRLGLLAYWRKTNAWPDFCSDPKLPYNCRKEAAKYPDPAS